MPRSRSLTRFTIRVGLEHFGQSVLLLVSMTFLRSPVLAIFAIIVALPGAMSRLARCTPDSAVPESRQNRNRTELLVMIVRDRPRQNRRRRTAIEALSRVYTTGGLKKVRHHRGIDRGNRRYRRNRLVCLRELYLSGCPRRRGLSRLPQTWRGRLPSV
jgi:hypothetical protein